MPFEEEWCVLQLGFWAALGALVAAGGVVVVCLVVRLVIKAVRKSTGKP
jgi:hypothetical protein